MISAGGGSEHGSSSRDTCERRVWLTRPENHGVLRVEITDDGWLTWVDARYQLSGDGDGDGAGAGLLELELVFVLVLVLVLVLVFVLVFVLVLAVVVESNG